MTTASVNAAQRSKFAVALRKAMARKGVGQGRLAEACHISEASVSHYRLAHNAPTLEVAHRLASVLDAPHLVQLVREARSFKCDNCGRFSVNDNYRFRRYCNEDCKRFATTKRGTKPADTRLRATRAERSLAVHRAAVAEMCNACEPEGLCHDGGCPLRTVSPFSFTDVPIIPVDEIRPRETSQRWLSSIRAFNEKRWTPEARAAAGERMRARHAAKTPEERSEHARATAAGIKAAKEHAA